MPWDQQPCDPLHSTCGNGTTADCHGRGPGYTKPSLVPLSDGTFLPQWLGYESNRIIAEKQFEGAKKIMQNQGEGGALKGVSGDVRSVHVYLKIANYTFNLPNGTAVKTCPAAMGFAFAGGTSDGPGALDFVQGDNGTSHNALWDIVKGAVTPPPSAEQVRCQAPKPILLNTGAATVPYNWAPDTVDIQMLRVGNFVMLIVPGELTTMAGRRLRAAVRASLISRGIIGSDAYVVVAGPANTYGHYITTKEEYGVQRYEGGSTIFGQYTLDAYINRYSSLVPFLAGNATGTPETDPAPADQTGNALSLQTGVVFDNAEIGKSFGQVLIDVKTSTYKAGDMVVVKFVGANPRNNLHLDGTFLTVDQLVSNNNWQTVRTDSHPSTVLRWERTNLILGYSTTNITWTIEPNTPSGKYRITYLGDYKNGLTGRIVPFTGRSGEFTVGA